MLFISTRSCYSQEKQYRALVLSPTGHYMYEYNPITDIRIIQTGHHATFMSNVYTPPINYRNYYNSFCYPNHAYYYSNMFRYRQW